MLVIEHTDRRSPRRTDQRRVGPTVAGFAPFLLLGAMLMLTVLAPPAVLLWLLAGGTCVILGCVTSLTRADRRGLHAHARGVLHSHRAGWKPHAHPTRAERLWSRWERWTGSPTPPAASGP